MSWETLLVSHPQHYSLERLLVFLQDTLESYQME
jgi:hypothetical protein